MLKKNCQVWQVAVHELPGLKRQLTIQQQNDNLELSNGRNTRNRGTCPGNARASTNVGTAIFCECRTLISLAQPLRRISLWKLSRHFKACTGSQQYAIQYTRAEVNQQGDLGASLEGVTSANLPRI